MGIDGTALALGAVGVLALGVRRREGSPALSVYLPVEVWEGPWKVKFKRAIFEKSGEFTIDVQIVHPNESGPRNYSFMARRDYTYQDLRQLGYDVIDALGQGPKADYAEAGARLRREETPRIWEDR